MKRSFFSKCLREEVRIGIVEPKEFDRIFIFLHGYNGNSDELERELPLTEYAAKYRLLIVCPDLGNGYYIDHEDRSVGCFLAKELPAQLKEWYDRNDETEVLLGGISMGGYGTVLTAAHFPQSFSHAVSVGGAFIAHSVSIGDEQVVGAAFSDPEAMKYYSDTFGPDFGTLNDCPLRNPLAAVKSLKGKQNIPKFILVCGEEDLLYERNLEAVKVLEESGVAYSWHTVPGRHLFDCFDAGVRLALDEATGMQG